MSTIILRRPFLKLFNYKNTFHTNFKHICSRKMTKKVLAIVASGTEEMELVISVDVLRRAGLSVTLAGLKDNLPTTCSRNIVLQPDTSLDKVSEEPFDAILLPGGLGGMNEFAASELLGTVLKRYESDGKIIAAICAAPCALATHSICLGKSLTSYPSMKDKLSDKYKYIDDELFVLDGQLLTSRGPGTAMLFSLKLAEVLVGEAKAQEVAKGLLVNTTSYKLD